MWDLTCSGEACSPRVPNNVIITLVVDRLGVYEVHMSELLEMMRVQQVVVMVEVVMATVWKHHRLGAMHGELCHLSGRHQGLKVPSGRI